MTRLSSGTLDRVTQFTVSVPDDVADRVSAAARDRGVSPDEIAREAFEAYLPGGPARRKLSFVGIGHSGRGDLSERAEDILRDELGA